MFHVVFLSIFRTTFDSTFVNGRRAQLVVFEFDEEPTEWLENNNFGLWEAGKVDPFFLKDFQFMTLKDEINEIPTHPTNIKNNPDINITNTITSTIVATFFIIISSLNYI